MRFLQSSRRAYQFILVVLDMIVVILSSQAFLKVFHIHLALADSVIWGLVLVFILYLIGSFGQTNQGRVAVRMSVILFSIITANFIIYPLLSGNDRIRIAYSASEMLTLLCVIGALHEAFYRHIDSHKQRLLIYLSRHNKKSYMDIQPQIEFVYQPVEVIYDNDQSPPTYNGHSHEKADIIVVDSHYKMADKLAKSLLTFKSKGNDVISFVELYSGITGRLPLKMIDIEWFVGGVALNSETVRNRRVKRVFDLLLATHLCVLFVIPMAIIWIAIYLFDGRPVIFRQVRLGKFGNEFNLYKFRTMHNNAEDGGPKWTDYNDNRITRTGNWLRRFHLDELPQLFNVLRGDISIVGPRPIRRYFTDILISRFPLYELRLLVNPGITGWAQVLGPYGHDMKEEMVKLEYDLYYIQNSNILHDIYVVFGTVRKMLLPWRYG